MRWSCEAEWLRNQAAGKAQSERIRNGRDLRPALPSLRSGHGAHSRAGGRVDTKMRAVAAQGRTADSLRVAVLAALNLADELSQATSADCNWATPAPPACACCWTKCWRRTSSRFLVQRPAPRCRCRWIGTRARWRKARLGRKGVQYGDSACDRLGAVLNYRVLAHLARSH